MEESTSTAETNHIQLLGALVSAYVSNNSIRAADLPELIVTLHRTLSSLGRSPGAAEEQAGRSTPAQIRKSITRDALISFIDHKPYKSLKRHLTKHGLDPEGYRERYGLPADYPMVAASYSEKRSVLAKATGLGRHAHLPDPAPTPVASGRPKGRAGSRSKTDVARAAESMPLPGNATAGGRGPRHD
ncbi:MucR family transcriptional regulator [Methylobacterium segetis]|uniref:MucR family transcriptional regulator n=1 Tax=Methylobacterium segetis TaxID=2488750 RepID=UPI001050E24D|nr:MucR family transcriptional regulator [Methylobacterium segetis]